MAQPRLDCPCVLPSVRQRIPAAMPQHVCMDREQQACTELRDHALRVLHNGQPAGLKLTPSGTVGVLRDALPDALEVGFQFGLGDGLLGYVALPSKAALMTRAVDGVAGGCRGVTTRGTAQSRHQRSRHSKVAEVPWETGTER
jgi:hypothetical protein